MKIMGMTIGEFSALIGVVGALIGWVAWMARTGYRALKNNIVRPLVEVLEDLQVQLKTDREWVHERHDNVVKRLDKHEETLDEHDEQLTRHEERIKTLFREKGNK